MTIGERVKQRRLELGLTQTELAERLGLKSKVSISTVENDKEDLTTDRIRKFADALERSPGYLMGWDAMVYSTGDTDFVLPIETKQRYSNRDSQTIIDAYKDIILIQQYKDLLRRPEIQSFLEVARDCDAETVRFATGVIKLKKDGEL